MVFPSNLHCHTSYSDGNGQCEDYIRAAVEKGFISIGISDHSPAVYDECGIPAEKYTEYLAEMVSLKKKYRDIIEVYTGIEREYYAPFDSSGLDYVIGSSHYLKNESGEFITIDYLHEDFKRAIDAFGSVQALVEKYYSNIADIARVQKPDIIGHLDIVGKLNIDNCYFDENSAWYDRLTNTVCDAIAQSGCIVELNTSGPAKKGRSDPFPRPPLLLKLRRRGIPTTLSSDAHATQDLDFWFSEGIPLLKECGYQSIRMLRGGIFTDFPIHIKGEN